MTLGVAERKWQEDALCREYPEVDFFPDDSLGVIRAQRICVQCAVRTECLEYALVNGEHHGVWGGTSERARHKIRFYRRHPELAPSARMFHGEHSQDAI